MKHMKLTEEEQKGTGPIEVDKPKYPYGLELHLDHPSLEKLGMKELPAVGSKMHLAAKVMVSGAMMHDGPGGKQKSLHLQITHMALAHGGEHEETDSDTKGKKLYGGEKEK